MSKGAELFPSKSKTTPISGLLLSISLSLMACTSAYPQGTLISAPGAREDELTAPLEDPKVPWLGQWKPAPCIYRLYSPDHKFAALLDKGKLTMASVDAKKGLWQSPPPGHWGQIFGADWSIDCKTLAIADKGGVFYIDAASGKQTGGFAGLAGRTYGPAYSPDGKYIAAIGEKPGAKVFAPTLLVRDAKTQAQIFERNEYVGNRVLWLDNQRIVHAGPNHQIQIWNVIENKQLLTIPAPQSGIAPFAASKDGRYLAVGDLNSNEIFIYNSSDGSAVTKKEFEELFDIAWSPDNKVIKVIGNNKTSDWQLDYADGQIKVVPIKEKVLGEKGYMPKTMEECLSQLKAELPESSIKAFKEGKEDDPVQGHMGLGMWIRNKWGLRSDSDLAKYFRPYGYYRGEAISDVILSTFWRELNGKPLDWPRKMQVPKLPEMTPETMASINKMLEKFKQEKEFDPRPEISKRILGLQLKKPDTIQSVRVPWLVGTALRCRYATKYNGKVFFNDKRYKQDDTFSAQSFVFNPANNSIVKYTAKTLDAIEDAVVVKSRLYTLGTRKNELLLCESNGVSELKLPLPPGSGWLTLGISQSGLLGIRKHAVYSWSGGRWNTLITTKYDLPKCVVPAERIGERIYFRDEGYCEDDKRLSWIDLTNPDTLNYFEQDTKMTGSQGPRWEFVNSYLKDKSNKLWISAGHSAQSLFCWTKKEGYKIAVMNNRLTFDGEHLFGPNEFFGINAKDIAITGMIEEGQDELLCIGPSGMYKLKGKTLTQVLRFSNASQDNSKKGGCDATTFMPTHIVKLGTEDYFIGTHWGGTLRLKKDQSGVFKLTLLG